jgi:hypothetical protein
VRLERNRATLAWEVGNDVLLDTRLSYGTDLDAEPIAPEVAAIQFLYYDGVEWVQEWDSIERGGLPLAVEIAVAMWPADAREQDANSLQTPLNFVASEQSEWLIYRQLVHLPMAQPASEEDTAAETSSEEPAGESSSGVTRASSASSAGGASGASAAAGGGRSGGGGR